MTTYVSTVDVSSFTTDAKFRTWGSAVSASLTAVGLTQTSDTGQINWTTVTKPIATSTKAGYEIWRFNGSLQSTAPVFIKIEYGSNGVTSGNGPNTWITIGTGSDGAGNISGVNTGAMQNGGSTVAPTNTAALIQACYVPTQGYLFIGAGIGLVSGAANHGGWWALSRTCDTSGAPTGDGISFLREATSASLVVTASGLNFATGQVYSSAAPACGMLRIGSSLATGSVVPLCKHYAAVGNLYPLNQIVTYYSTDIVAGTTFSSTVWGSTSHTYFAHGATVATSANAGADATAIPATLWE